MVGGPRDTLRTPCRSEPTSVLLILCSEPLPRIPQPSTGGERPPGRGFALASVPEPGGEGAASQHTCFGVWKPACAGVGGGGVAPLRSPADRACLVHLRPGARRDPHARRARGARAPGIYRFSFTHDAQGLRVDPAPAGAVPRYTVLVLGDSFTYGLGVDDDRTFCHLLQEALAPDLPTRVVNAGNPGKGTDYALRFFLLRQATLRPDLVLFGFFKNDFGDNARDTYFSLTPTGRLEPRPPRDARSRRRLLLERLPGFSWLLSRSHLVNLFRQAAVRLTVDKFAPGQPTSRPEDGPRGLVWVDESE